MKVVSARRGGRKVADIQTEGRHALRARGSQAVSPAAKQALLTLTGFAELYDTDVESVAAAFGQQIRSGDKLSADPVDMLFLFDGLSGSTGFGAAQTGSDQSCVITFDSSVYGYHVDHIDITVDGYIESGGVLVEDTHTKFSVKVEGSEANPLTHMGEGVLRIDFGRTASADDKFTITMPMAQSTAVEWRAGATAQGRKPKLNELISIAAARGGVRGTRMADTLHDAIGRNPLLTGVRRS